MNLRKSAKGMPCTLQVPGVCNYDNSTTVLAHIRSQRVERMIREQGIRMPGDKPPDESGVFACSECHEWMGDGNVDMYYDTVEPDYYQLIAHALIVTHVLQRQLERGN